MTPIDELTQEPWRFDFFDTMRRLERQFGREIKSDPGRPNDTSGRPALPRIGDAATRRDEYALLGQDPFFAFPASNLSLFSAQSDRRFSIFVKFLGLLGPQGALPLATTEEAWRWSLVQDDAFPRFLDILNHRFLQLFYRAWADSRPAAQHDRPDSDRFVAYVGSTIGVGSPIFEKLDLVPDAGKLSFAGLLGSKAKSAARLASAIRGMFGVEAEIEEFVGSWLELSPDDRTLLGGSLCGLGVDTMVGSSCYSVQDKIRVRLFVSDMAEYRRFLPEGQLCEPLVDLLYFCLGDEIDWDVELHIPARQAPGAGLGVRAQGSAASAWPFPTQLGWTSWLSPRPNDGGIRSDARFHALERTRAKRAGGAAGRRNEGTEDG